MKKRILRKSEWQDISVDFFLEEVFPRFLDKKNDLSKLVMEIQHFPSLCCGYQDDRTFISPRITIDFPFSERMKKLKKDLLKGGTETLKNFEENHLLGFVMSASGNEPEYKIDCVTFSKSSIYLFLKNLGVDYKKEDPIISLWYNLKKDGKIDRDFEKVTPNRKIRIRYLSFPYFMEAIQHFKETDYKCFPYDFTKDDYEEEWK